MSSPKPLRCPTGILLRAVRRYLDQTHQPNHAVLLTHRVEARGACHMLRRSRHDGFAELRSEKAPRFRGHGAYLGNGGMRAMNGPAPEAGGHLHGSSS